MMDSPTFFLGIIGQRGVAGATCRQKTRMLESEGNIFHKYKMVKEEENPMSDSKTAQ